MKGKKSWGKKWVWGVAASGVLAAGAGAAYAVWRYMSGKKAPPMGEYVGNKYESQEELVKAATELIEEGKEKYNTQEHFKKMFSLIDYTTLDVADTTAKVSKMIEFVNNLPTTHPHLPSVAAICVYPPFVSQIKKGLTNKKVGIASVSGGFPASQTTLDVKIMETKYAVKSGADDIDIVLSVGKFLERKYEECFEEIHQLKRACGSTANLKVILEVDSLKDPNLIYHASMLAMDAGADFIKTSTGKVDRDEKLFEARLLVMCEAIRDFRQKTGRVVSIKPAGGIRNAEQALRVYTLISVALTEEYQHNKRFRIGASSLAEALIAKIASF